MTLPVAFGCMRLSTDATIDEARGLAVIAAAIDGGATLLDTAPSYAIDEAHTHANERLVAQALAAFPLRTVEVSTKAGLVRVGGAWVADGRAKAIRASCEGSLRALGRGKLDLLLLHTVDPKTPISTSARALAELVRAGLVERAGLCNVNVEQIEEARRYVDVRAVQVAVSPFDGTAFTGGVVAHCRAAGIPVFAHSPFGGPRRAKRLFSHAEVVTWLRSLGIVAVPGATQADHARRATAAAFAPMDATRAEALSRQTGAKRPERHGPTRGEIVILMGIQGAGKSTSVRAFEHAGYARLNRDARGGTMAALTEELERRAASGETRFVLDNLYLTRASRAPVVDVGARHDLDVRCIWLDTSREDAELNVVSRLFERYGKVPDMRELRLLVKEDPQAFGPSTLTTSQRALEAPVSGEGFSSIERRPFARVTAVERTEPGVVVDLKSLAPVKRSTLETVLGSHPFTHALVIAWDPGADEGTLRTHVERGGLIAGLSSVEVALCSHGAGAPTCWCRPPLPGLIVPWLSRRRIDPRASLLVGSQPAHERLAAMLRFTYARV
ncbi:MAG: aldo/keto reductase [Myxococcales bacterium]|nr:aldo/keto reductase [Myxococcales bacterium]